MRESKKKIIKRLPANVSAVTTKYTNLDQKLLGEYLNQADILKCDRLKNLCNSNSAEIKQIIMHMQNLCYATCMDDSNTEDQTHLEFLVEIDSNNKFRQDMPVSYPTDHLSTKNRGQLIEGIKDDLMGSLVVPSQVNYMINKIKSKRKF